MLKIGLIMQLNEYYLIRHQNYHGWTPTPVVLENIVDHTSEQCFKFRFHVIPSSKVGNVQLQEKAHNDDAIDFSNEHRLQIV